MATGQVGNIYFTNRGRTALDRVAQGHHHRTGSDELEPTYYYFMPMVIAVNARHTYNQAYIHTHNLLNNNL